MRLLHELTNWTVYSFVTLTYSEECLPTVGGPFSSRGTLCRRDFTLYCKRLRRAIAPRKLKYYACGEYGATTLRPHYHAILFGVSDRKIIETAWSKGFVKVLPVSVETFRYVTGYIDKGASWSRIRADYTAAGLEPPFKAQSTGLGKQYALDNERIFSNRKYLTVNGFKYGLPRYYRRLYGLTQDDYADIISDMSERKFIEYLSKYKFSPTLFYPLLRGEMKIENYYPFYQHYLRELHQRGLILDKKFTDAGVKRLR